LAGLRRSGRPDLPITRPNPQTGKRSLRDPYLTLANGRFREGKS